MSRSYVAQNADIPIEQQMHNDILHKSIRINAWAQVLLVLMILVAGFFGRCPLNNDRHKTKSGS
ncbi:MAG: hypothetical protein K9I85_12510 [Saprospiraceae bacterium]|nr:hypothetical protein [Saprospiraceae bacterium]